MRIPVFGKVTTEQLFDDSKLWEIPEVEDEEHRLGDDSETANDMALVGKGEKEHRV